MENDQKTQTIWIRTKNIPEQYQVGKTYAWQLIKDMQESRKYGISKNFIIDGRIKLVRRSALEDFWRERRY